MSSSKSVDYLANIQNIDFRNIKNHDAILTKNLTQLELKSICKRIKKQLKIQKDPQSLNALNLLKKTLKSKYSIDISNQIIQKFIHTTQLEMIKKKSMNFEAIDKQIKVSLEEINKKKYYINNNKTIGSMGPKPQTQSNGKRRKLVISSTEAIPCIKSVNNSEGVIIKEKLSILKDYIDRDDLLKFERQINKKLQTIDPQQYGKYSDKIKVYTIYDSIIQKIFMLIQEDTKNIQIRKRYNSLYKQMKQQMVAIVTNQDEIVKAIESIKKTKMGSSCCKNHLLKPSSKKNYFQLEKDKQDLTTQIEQTIEAAKKHLKQAFIKRGRPDYAYDMECAMQNRKTPFTAVKRVQF